MTFFFLLSIQNDPYECLLQSEMFLDDDDDYKMVIKKYINNTKMSVKCSIFKNKMRLILQN